MSAADSGVIVPGVSWRVELGDCVERLRGLAPASVDAICTDPPYGLEFMGKDWDRLGGPRMQEWHEAWALEALRVLRPGGHLLAFGGSRTYHRLACAIEDAGFEIRDTIMWLYGSGFPKSLDVSKAIDKAAGAEREVVGQRTDGRYAHGFSQDAKRALGGVVAESDPTGFSGEMGQITAPATPEAERWEGWGTALKPAHEPVVVARKPLVGTVAGNVLAHGTGAVNVDGCRIAIPDAESYGRNHSGDRGHDGTRALEGRGATDLRMGGGSAALARWPANVVLDPAAAALLDAQTGELRSGDGDVCQESGADRNGNTSAAYGAESRPAGTEMVSYGDAGGASRFFYCAKAGRAERNAGLERSSTPLLAMGATPQQAEDADWSTRNGNHHPTVKPIELMRWLVRLVTPPGGLVLDPFAGSGTTGVACVLEGFEFVGVERDPEYARIAEARIGWWAAQPAGLSIEQTLAGDGERRKVADRGQESLFA